MFFKIKKYMFYYLRNTNEMECKQLSGWQSTLSTFSDFCLLGRPNSQLGRLATKVVTNGLRNGFEFSQEKSCLGAERTREPYVKVEHKAKVKNGRSRLLLKNTQRVDGGTGGG